MGHFSPIEPCTVYKRPSRGPGAPPHPWGHAGEKARTRPRCRDFPSLSIRFLATRSLFERPHHRPLGVWLIAASQYEELKLPPHTRSAIVKGHARSMIIAKKDTDRRHARAVRALCPVGECLSHEACQKRDRRLVSGRRAPGSFGGANRMWLGLDGPIPERSQCASGNCTRYGTGGRANTRGVGRLVG